MGATQGCFWFLGIGRIAIVQVEKLETKRKPCWRRRPTCSVWCSISSWHKGWAYPWAYPHQKSIRGTLQNEPFNLPGLHGGQIVEVWQAVVVDYVRQYPVKHRQGNTTGDILHKMSQEKPLQQGIDISVSL